MNASRRSSLEVSLQSIERSDGGKRRRLGAQHARADLHRHETLRRERRFLLGAESRFGSRRENDRLAFQAQLR